MVGFRSAILGFMLYVAEIIADKPPNAVCQDTGGEEFGWALIGHDYKSSTAENFGQCFFDCTLDEQCQSATFLWNTKECKLKKETKKSRPMDMEENPAATYMENPFRAKKGSKASIPGSSCKDILASGDAKGNGGYWIDPTDSGNPFPVYCDMNTDRGGWLLISRFIMETLNSSNESSTESDSYRTILPAYTSNNQYLLRSGFNQLKQDMGFTQIRFYCFKNATGRAFHIMTNDDTNGTNVVNFFTTSDNIPVACGSFTRLPDDNSSLAVNCDKWGQPTKNRWGHASRLTNDRLFLRPLTWSHTRFYRLKGGSKYQCDDKTFPLSVGDIWQVFVR